MRIDRTHRVHLRLTAWIGMLALLYAACGSLVGQFRQLAAQEMNQAGAAGATENDDLSATGKVVRSQDSLGK